MQAITKENWMSTRTAEQVDLKLGCKIEYMRIYHSVIPLRNMSSVIKCRKSTKKLFIDVHAQHIFSRQWREHVSAQETLTLLEQVLQNCNLEHVDPVSERCASPAPGLGVSGSTVKRDDVLLLSLFESVHAADDATQFGGFGRRNIVSLEKRILSASGGTKTRRGPKHNTDSRSRYTSQHKQNCHVNHRG